MVKHLVQQLVIHVVQNGVKHVVQQLATELLTYRESRDWRGAYQA